MIKIQHVTNKHKYKMKSFYIYFSNYAIVFMANINLGVSTFEQTLILPIKRLFNKKV